MYCSHITVATKVTVHSFPLFGYMSVSAMILWRFYIGGNSKSVVDVYVKCPIIFSPILTKFELSPLIFIEVSVIKNNANSSSGSRVDSCGQTDAHDEANRPVT